MNEHEDDIEGSGRGGNDRLIGGMGEDTVVGDGAIMDPTVLGGNDSLWGDPQGAAAGGADVFFFAGLIGKALVNDFRRADGDTIQLDYGDVLDEFSELVFSTSGNDTIIDIGASTGLSASGLNIIRLDNVDDLQASDVTFGPLTV